MKKVIIYLVSYIFLAMSPSLANSCFDRFQTQPNTLTEINMRVTVNGFCTLKINEGRKGGKITKFVLRKKPKNGVAGSNMDDVYLAYKPNNGFIGKDNFTIRINYFESNKMNITDLKVNVLVSSK